MGKAIEAECSATTTAEVWKLHLLSCCYPCPLRSPTGFPAPSFFGGFYGRSSPPSPTIFLRLIPTPRPSIQSFGRPCQRQAEDPLRAPAESRHSPASEHFPERRPCVSG